MGWGDWCLGIGILLVLAAIIMLIVLIDNKELISTTNWIIDGCLGGVGLLLLLVYWYTYKPESGPKQMHLPEPNGREGVINAHSVR